MGGINATENEKKQLAMKGYSDPVVLPGANGPPKAIYHNPITGQEFKNLPADSYNLVHYLARGLSIGPASEILQETWKNREPEETNETITGAILPEELKDPTAKLRDEISELKEMILGLVKEQPSVPISGTIDIVEEKEEEIIPFDTQLGMII